MEPAGYFHGMMFDAGQRAKKHSPLLIGIVSAPPWAEIFKSEISPALPYFHVRSGQGTVFYFAGYFEARDHHPPDAERASGQSEWVFSSDAFNTFRAELEKRSRWKYSGGSDLILLTSRRGSRSEDVDLDWSSALSVNLEKAKNDGAFLSVSMLFERIFRSAEERTRPDAVFEVSESLGGSVAKQALWHALVSFLPEGVRGDATIARHFVTENLSL